jgi:hypothetical protein
MFPVRHPNIAPRRASKINFVCAYVKLRAPWENKFLGVEKLAGPNFFERALRWWKN